VGGVMHPLQWIALLLGVYTVGGLILWCWLR
jgi:hypothetical protein